MNTFLRYMITILLAVRVYLMKHVKICALVVSRFATTGKLSGQRTLLWFLNYMIRCMVQGMTAHIVTRGIEHFVITSHRRLYMVDYSPATECSIII